MTGTTYNINSIKICCDFLMTRFQTQRYHLKWYSIIVERALKRVTSLPIKAFMSDDFENANTFKREAFFNLSGIDLNLDETHSHFDIAEISDASIDYASRFLNNTVIIGYELSEQTRELLDKIGCHYIDIWLHPVRFLEDNFYAYLSSNENIQKEILKHSIPEETYYLYADRIKIQSTMGWDKFSSRLNSTLSDNSCLFVGQTLTDKAVCRDGKMLTVLDYKEEFKQLTNDYDHVYFSPHPMLKGDDSEQNEFLETFDNVSIIKEAGYQLLCCDKIKKVVAISSSLVYESKFFNKENQFFYRPIVPILSDGEFCTKKYASIYNKLHSPTFWADILSPVIETIRPNVEIDYFSTKNVYRDMLSLYYNNKVFDKEHFTHEFVKNSKNNISKPKKNISEYKKYFSNTVSLEKIKNEINKNDIVSFDIFDTIVQRSINNPGDIVKIVSDYAFSEFGIDKEDFLKARRDCKSLSSYQYETPLLERYKIMMNLLSQPDYIAGILHEYEMKVDYELLEPRLVGIKLIDIAKALGKRVILTSDIFYREEFIIKILQKCKIENYDSLYISSEFDLTKESGSLYRKINKSEKGKVLHIGDSKHSDYDMALKEGIKAVHLLSNKDQIKDTVQGFVGLEGEYSNIRNGLIQENISKFPIITKSPGHFSGKAYNFGYNVVGDMFLAFSHWILGNAKDKGINKIAFLARDGEIIKHVFDSINDSGIETTYLLASRRCVRVASLFNKDDVLNEIELFSNSINDKQKDIYSFISLRFGLKKEEIIKLDEMNVFSEKASPTVVKSFLSQERVIEDILMNADSERKLYLKYLHDNNIDANTAFVDIGHNGSLQASISKLLNLKSSVGFYFSTYDGISKTLSSVNGDHKGFGFYRDKISVSEKNDLYIKYALTIETLFLNTQGTFLKFDELNSPVYLSTSGEEKRIKFITELQAGILDYTEDFSTTLNKLSFKIQDSISFSLSYDACKRFFSIMQKPVLRDAQTFSGVTIENYFSGRDIRYITPLAGDVSGVTLWKEGTKLIREHNPMPIQASLVKDLKNPNLSSKKNRVLGRFVAKSTLSITTNILYFTLPLINKKKMSKLLRDKDSFYKDSKNNFIKRVWALSK